jgi:putative tricarboxylic transport membrane protein
MRRDTSPKSLAVLAASSGLPLSALAATNIKMMISDNPGAGRDATGRAPGKALQDAKVADAVTCENKGGAAGAVGLAQFVNASKGDPNALMVMGAVMLGGTAQERPRQGEMGRWLTGLYRAHCCCHDCARRGR